MQFFCIYADSLLRLAFESGYYWLHQTFTFKNKQQCLPLFIRFHATVIFRFFTCLLFFCLRAIRLLLRLARRHAICRYDAAIDAVGFRFTGACFFLPPLIVDYYYR